MPRMKKGVWLHNLAQFKNADEVRGFARKYADEGFDLLIPCVKNPDGLLDYHSRIGNVRPVFRDWDPLEVLAREARRVRIKVHAWYCNSREGPKSKLLQRYPGAVAVLRDGKPSWDRGKWAAFVCIARPEVRAYEAAIMKEVVDNYDIAGVHFDYIRVGDGTCYCPRCRKVLKRLEGIMPDKIRFWSRMSAKWFDWRVEQVTKLVREVSKYAHRKGKEVSAAVYSGVPESYISQGQDFTAWSREGLLDMVAPMNYANSPLLMERYLWNHIAHNKGGKAELWEGLGRYCMDNREQFKEQLSILKRHKVKGVVIFEHNRLARQDFKLLSRY